MLPVIDPPLGHPGCDMNVSWLNITRLIAKAPPPILGQDWSKGEYFPKTDFL